MVGYVGSGSLSANDYAIVGAVSSGVCRALLQPADVLKIRFQLQVEPLRAGGGKYSGVWQAARCIMREEGVAALWKGHVPAQILSISYGAVQFSTFEVYTMCVHSIVSSGSYTGYSNTIHTLCGGLAGCTATLLTYPVDTVRTRLIAQGEPKTYTGVVDAFIKLVGEEGGRSLFRGLCPTLLQIFPYMAAQFGLYNVCKTSLNAGGFEPGSVMFVLSSSMCGAVSGVGAKTMTYPLDFIKKRLQIQGFHQARNMLGETGVYSGVVDCCVRVVAEEGLAAMFKGLYPGLIKAGLTSACLFCLYDNLCTALKSTKTQGSDSNEL